MKPYVLLLVGCALTSKAKPLEVQYYEPTISVGSASASSSASRSALAHVRLGRVEPSEYLRTDIVHRTSDVELGVYASRRWTDSPDTYVRRALEQALFVERAMDQVTSQHAMTLDVDVIAFEEVTSPAGGRVQLAYRLRVPRGTRSRLWSRCRGDQRRARRRLRTARRRRGAEGSERKAGRQRVG